MKRKYSNSSRNKFSDFLTVLLVLVIIAILALVGFFGYKAINKKSIEVGSQNAYDTFQNSIKNNVVTKNEIGNEVENEVENQIDNSVQPDFSNLIEQTNTIEGNTQNQTTNPTTKPETQKQYYEGYEVKGSINIPKTGIKYVILGKVTPKSLAAAPAILDIVGTDSMSGTIKSLNVPGTNALILGHNYRNGLFFSDNYKLELGDKIIITDEYGTTVNYTIYKMYYTDASDASFMERELDPDVREITLQTCNDDSSQRLIIWAKDK